MLLGGAALLAGGWYVLGFLAEPSAVDRVRILMIAIGAGGVLAGIVAALVGVWMLLPRRT